MDLHNSIEKINIKCYNIKWEILTKVKGGTFMDDKVRFEKYGIEFTDEDFENVDKETLLRCKKKLEAALEKIEKNN